jgi:hypothetical protein
MHFPFLNRYPFLHSPFSVPLSDINNSQNLPGFFENYPVKNEKSKKICLHLFLVKIIPKISRDFLRILLDKMKKARINCKNRKYAYG